MYFRFIPVVFVSATLLSACVGTTPPLETTDVPGAWQAPLAGEAQIWPDTAWWTGFQNEELNSLITQVQANNFDLANNQRNLEAAQLTLREAGFALLPTPSVTIGTGARYSRTDGDTGSVEDSGGDPFSLNAGLNYTGILSKPATYERAVADYEGRVAQAADLALNTLGTAASTYFQLLLTRDRVVAAQQNLANAEAIGIIAQARVDAGVAVPIEALQQQIAIERERANLRSLAQSDLSTRASLALLVGRNVQGFDMSGQTLDALSVPQVQPGLPSELLRRRPDLVQSEASLRSANANLTVVRTALFPQINLTGNASAASLSLTELVTSPDSALTVSATLVQTLLDNGQRFRNIDQAKLSLETSLANYRRAVLGALNEVEVLLSNIQLLEQQGQVALRNLEAAEESFRIAELRYQEGLSDYQTMLQSQNTLFSTRNSWLDSKLQQLNARISLFQALGGGWQADTDPLLSLSQAP
ncbi:MAG: TolC family protein [Pseudomonadales bacterium]|nr:TolC family protein [Pseudomonadales bacterium]